MIKLNKSPSNSSREGMNETPKNAQARHDGM